MANQKEILFYDAVYDFTAEALIGKLNELKGEDVLLRVNTPGGSVFAAYGVYQKMKEQGNITVMVDGAAMSAGAFLPLFAKNVKALDVARFLFHRADMWVENEEDQKFLDNVNKDLRLMMEQRVNGDKFLAVTGQTIDALFDPTKRINITINAEQAKMLGIVDEVIKLTPEIKKQVEANTKRYYEIAASAIGDNKQATQQKTDNNMNLEKLKAEHPAIYAEAVAIGVKQGIEQEKDRVEACLVFNEVDPAGVKAAIEAGKPLSQKQMADFALKALSKNQLAALAQENAASSEEEEEDVNGAGEEGKENKKQKDEVEAFKAGVYAHLGLKQPK